MIKRMATWSIALLLLCVTSLVQAASTLSVDQQLTVNQYLASNNGKYRFYMQGDGNLVLRDESMLSRSVKGMNIPMTGFGVPLAGLLILFPCLFFADVEKNAPLAVIPLSTTTLPTTTSENIIEPDAIPSAAYATQDTNTAELVKSARLSSGGERTTDQETNKDETAHLLSRLLQDYHSSKLEPEEPRAIRAILPEISRSTEGRELIAKFFFDEQSPEIADSMYDMILDASLKDASLITELIERDETEYRLDYKTRLIDLIADHNTIEQPHTQKIEDFLADMAVHPDDRVRLAAISQWAWYVKQHKGIVPVLDAYLFNHASPVR